MSGQLPAGARTADEAIYLNANRSHEPKQIFLRFAAIAEPESHRIRDILDIGCAAGELLAVLGKTCPAAQLTGIDVVPSLLAAAAERVPSARFQCASLEDAGAIPADAYDLVTCSGVVEIFDDLTVPLTQIVRALRPGGLALVQSIFNPQPIDVLMRYRRADTAGEWERGWNMHARVTVERMLRALSHDGLQLSHEWEPFRLPMALPPRDDVMRAWTVNTEADPFQQVNGAGQWLHPTILHIRRVA